MRARPLACEISRAVFAALALASLCLVLLLAASPQWHERVHADADQAQHECAVTLIAHSKAQQCDAPVLVAAPQPAVQFAFVPVLTPIWVQAPFLGACVFEHAPPALS